ncbi:MAG: hypothetical protein GX442_04425 [Candidatus Riflebacteria bacterium]|nr:hypothetical protein [Candidatus Riflebacteria bacterium]
MKRIITLFLLLSVLSLPVLAAETETASSTATASEAGALPPEVVKDIEARITAFANQHGFTTERDAQGRLVVKDKDGKLVPLPPGVLPPPPEVIKELESRITAFANEKGFTTERDGQGRLVVKDKDGNLVPLPPGMLPPGLLPPPPPPPAELIKEAEARITAFANDKGFTTERDAQGRLVVKDKDGNLVPLPPGLLPPGLLPPPPIGTASADVASDTESDSGSSDSGSSSAEGTVASSSETTADTPEDAVDSQE